jgi:tetratricopeptide (TPR) repeat protein
MLNDFRFNSCQVAVTLSEFDFSGEDVESFLQTQSTFDIHQLEDNQFHLASFLDPQGRVECYGWVTKKDNHFSYLVPPSLAAQTLSRLTKFLISEDVKIAGPNLKNLFFSFGDQQSDGICGVLFDEEVKLISIQRPGVPLVPDSEAKLWGGLTGWPSFDGRDYSFEILNNHRLFDLSLTLNKGCYPGQETVSKIATRRGAAYAPVLIMANNNPGTGDLYSFEKKIGKVENCYEWEGRFYLAAHLLRDFRVELMKFHFTLNEKEMEGVVRYYPLIKGDNTSKAQELFFAAVESFRFNNLENAELKLRKAIQIDPAFADAYESLGVMLGRQDRFDEAIELMKQLVLVDPLSVLAHTNLSLFLMKQGKIEEAEEQKSLATVKSFQSFGIEARKKESESVIHAQQKKEWEQREEMFRQVLEIDPEDTLANYGLGSIALEKRQWDLAREHLRKVLNNDPKYSVAYLALGKALKGLGLKNEAIEVWSQGIKVAASKGDLMPANQMQQELSLYE